MQAPSILRLRICHQSRCGSREIPSPSLFSILFPQILKGLSFGDCFHFACCHLQVSAIFKECGIQNLSVQVEKEAYYQHMSGLSVTFDQMVEMTQQINAIGQQDNGLYDIKAV